MVDYSGGLGEGKVGHQPRLEPSSTMIQHAHPKEAQPNPEALYTRTTMVAIKQRNQTKDEN